MGVVTIGTAVAYEGNKYGITFIVMTVHKVVTIIIWMVSKILEDCAGSSKVPALTSGKFITHEIKRNDRSVHYSRRRIRADIESALLQLRRGVPSSTNGISKSAGLTS